MDNHINVLLIEDNPGDTRLIRELFAEVKGMTVCLLCADRLSSGIQQISDGGVDVILLDLNLPDSHGFDTFGKLRAHADELPVILMTGVDDEELATQCVREGAQDYMVKGTVTPQSLARSIRFAVERQRTASAAVDSRPKAEPGRVLAFLGAKGGVGTTTIALNTAAVLARQKKSVIALELRPYGGSFSSQTQQNPSRTLRYLLDLEPDQITPTPIRKCLVALPFGVQAIFAPQKPDEFAEFRPGQPEAIIRCAQLMADYVILDLASSLSPLSQAAVTRSDLLTLVVERNTDCVTAGRQAVQLLTHWGVEESAIAAAVVIKDALAAYMSLPDIGVRLGCAVAGAIPPAAEACVAASKMGTPLILMEPDSIAATGLTTLAEKLAARTLASMAN